MATEPELELAELLAEVRRIEVLSRRLATDVMSGGYSSVFRGAGVEFSEVREYVEGDDPRSVDWNVTARLGRPFVKRFVDERELTMVFMLDLSASMNGGWGAWSARRTAALFCACLAFSAVRNNDRIGLLGFGSAVERHVPPGKGLGHALRIVRDVLALPPASEGTDLVPALEFASRALPRHAVLFLITDFLATGWEERIWRCAPRHDLVAVRLLAPELSPPPSGPLRVRDPEGGARRVVDWSAADQGAALAARVAAWRTATEDALDRARVDLVDLEVPREPDREAVVKPILRFFRMRELRGAKR